MSEQTTLLSQQWHEILPPLPPEPVSLWVILSSLLLVLLAVVVVYILWQQRPRQRARRELRRCTRQLQHSASNSKEIAMRMHRALLQGLSLNPASALSEQHRRDIFWELFYRQLQECVFQPVAPSPDELARLLRQCSYWLRHFPR